MGFKADEVNCTETKEGVARTPRGGAPIPIIGEPKRKRGYHRALKAGKSWALLKQGINRIMTAMASDMFSWKNPFLNMKPDEKYVIDIK